MYKKALAKILFKSPAYKIFPMIAKGAKILCYHGVEKEIIDSRVQVAHMPIDNFKRQMKYLNENFEVISIDYLADCLKYNYQLHPNQICISFDDGYRNVLSNAATVLKTFNFPYSVFIPTWHIGNGVRLPTYYLRAAAVYTKRKTIKFPSINRTFYIETDQDRLNALEKILKIVKRMPHHFVKSIMDDNYNLIDQNKWSELDDTFHSDQLMNWNEIKKISHLGATIGSHCHHHEILHSLQTPKQIDYQLRTSKNLITRHIGKCKYIAYPNGGQKDISDYTVWSVQQHKYELGLTLMSGEIDKSFNPFLLPRIWAPSDFDIFKYAVTIRNNLPNIFRY